MVTSSKNAMGLALDTLVPTPTGWLKAGDLQIGNKVLLSDGTAAEVKNMEVTEAKTFSLTFTGVAPASDSGRSALERKQPRRSHRCRRLHSQEQR